jgi:hypothetical protein
MRRDSFAAGFWCALVVVVLILVAGREEEPRPEVLPVAAPATSPASVTAAARFIPEPPREPAPEPPRPVVEREAAYTGNANTHRFHRLSCRYASCTNCTAQFATRQEALDAGYRPGGCCNP